MNRFDRRRYEMLVRVRKFGEVNGQLFPSTSTAHAAFAELGTQVDRLTALDVAERTATKAGRIKQREAARKTLVRTLLRASATAGVVAMTHPEFSARVDLPLPFDAVLLLSIGRQFIAEATPFAEEFAGHGIPIAEVQGHLDAFERTLHERGQRQDERLLARREAAEAFDRAMRAVAVVDVSVANCLVATPAIQDVWRQVKVVGHWRKRPATVPGDEPAASTGEPAPAASTDTPAAADTPAVPAVAA